MDTKIITTELLEYYDAFIKEYINEKFNAISYNLKVYVDEHLAGKADNEDIDELKQTIDNLTLGTLSETDPTVPAWAKQSTKPSYTADEIEGIDAIVESYVEETILGGEW